MSIEEQGIDMEERGEDTEERGRNMEEQEVDVELPEASPSEIELLFKAVMQGNTAKVRLLLKKRNFNNTVSARKIKYLYKQIDDKRKEMEVIRKDFFQHFQKRDIHPLSCKGDRCETCRNSDPGQMTCLPFIQELFLWSLQTQSIELALIFWEYCEDKIASALVAWALKTAMSLKKQEQDRKWQLEEDAMQFQQLAVSTLKRCDEVNCTLTESLLIKPCPWWNNVSVLQLVVELENRDFMAQTACTKFMTRLWHKKIAWDGVEGPRHYTLVDMEPDFNRCCCYLESRPNDNCFKPVVKYVFYMFLDFGPERHKKCCPFRLQRMRYWRQTWNLLDVLIIVLFGIGMLAFHDDEGLHIFGRTVLCIDFFFYCIRLLKLLMVFEELGLMLVMVRKMIRDTINFMFILLIFVLAYAISSEAILYEGDRASTWHQVFLVPRKAYWQVFGELFLDEIETDCSNRSCSHIVGDEDCPSSYGRYIVPIMLGIYIIITNVLLLNLLIARFNKTFEEVHDQAVEYQTWYRSVIIIEFHHRTHWPLPYNIFILILELLKFLQCFNYIFRRCREKCSKTQRGGTASRYQDSERMRKFRKIRALEAEQVPWARDDARARLILAIDKKRKNKNSLVLIYKKLEEIEQKINERNTANDIII